MKEVTPQVTPHHLQDIPRSLALYTPHHLQDIPLRTFQDIPRSLQVTPLLPHHLQGPHAPANFTRCKLQRKLNAAKRFYDARGGESYVVIRCQAAQPDDDSCTNYP